MGAMQNDTGSGTPKLGEDLSSLGSFLRAALVVLLRAGMAQVHTSVAPEYSADLIVLHHILDFAVATLSFWLAGYALAYGNDVGGVVGAGPWVPASAADWDLAVHGWCATLVATGVLSCAAAGRLPQASHAALSAVHAALLQPLLLHWTAHPAGWLAASGIAGHRVSFKDVGGGGAVHTASGAAAAAVGAALGQRLAVAGELDAGWRRLGQPPSSTAAGHALVACGLAALALPPARNLAAAVGACSALGGAGAALVEVVLWLGVWQEPLDYWAPLALLQAGIAGVVAVSSGADVYVPAVSVAVGALGGLVHGLVRRLVLRSALEDPTNAVATHLACGALACLLPPLVGSAENMGLAHPRHVGVHLAWQLLGLLALIGTTLAVYCILLALFACLRVLRCSAEDNRHCRALLRGGPAFPRRLYSPADGAAKLVPGEPIPAS